ncbi:hypothetical protein, partial [uncultured Allobaculum sp.]|uniref:hypothetical protein n=1 Tax=uncultured Allobaculum sp. TaxID=1187017 RepID=UPI0025904DFC
HTIYLCMSEFKETFSAASQLAIFFAPPERRTNIKSDLSSLTSGRSGFCLAQKTQMGAAA